VADDTGDGDPQRPSFCKSSSRSRGRFLGGRRPFGYRIADDGSLEACEKERKALVAIRRMQKAGKSLRDIAAAIQARGIDISHQGVKKLLARTREAT
jgi:putative DNA-invertase from lambdoid prophage Rac